jgi:hypothetical protein
MSNDINNSVENILLHKANLIKGSVALKERHIKNLFKEYRIDYNENNVRIFLMGAVDAMVYDMGCALDFTKQKGNINDWTSYEMRKIIINKLWEISNG